MQHKITFSESLKNNVLRTATGFLNVDEHESAFKHFHISKPSLYSQLFRRITISISSIPFALLIADPLSRGCGHYVPNRSRPCDQASVLRTHATQMGICWPLFKEAPDPHHLPSGMTNTCPEPAVLSLDSTFRSPDMSLFKNSPGDPMHS